MHFTCYAAPPKEGAFFALNTGGGVVFNNDETFLGGAWLRHVEGHACGGRVRNDNPDQQGCRRIQGWTGIPKVPLCVLADGGAGMFCCSVL